MSAICNCLGVSRAAFYKSNKKREKKPIEEKEILNRVMKIRVEMPRIGTRKLLHCLKNNPDELKINIGRDSLFDLLRRNNLLCERRKVFVPKTTKVDLNLPISTNLTSNLEINQPNQVLISDITYIRVNNNFAYLSLVTDRFCRDIIGWNLSTDLTAAGPITAIKMAMKTVPAGLGTIAHSDRGSQYASHAYRNILNRYGLRSSMTERHHCYENSAAERVNGILKGEFFLDQRFKSFKEAKCAIRNAIQTYNTKRPHEMLGYLTPAEVRRNLERAQPLVLAAFEASKKRSARKAEKRRQVNNAVKAS